MPICCMCHEDKPEDAFAFRSLATGERQSHCRECHAAYRRQHYLNNKPIYIAREIARMNAYRIENRLRIFEYLSGHPCVDCGETDPVVLEFDHRDRATKRSEVARLSASKPWKVVFLEIQKCDVRCGNCHRRKTAKQLNWSIAAPFVSLPAPEPASILLRLLTGEELRECSLCHELKPLGEYSIKNKKTGRRARRCHACIAAASRDHYRRNRGYYIAKARRNRTTSRSRNGQHKRALLQGLTCVDCGEIDPVVMEFDHRDGVEKIGNVSRLMDNGWTLISSEIAKCDIRCVNCHRRRTAKQFGWMKASLAKAVGTMELTRE